MANGHGGFASGTPGATISALEERIKELETEIAIMEANFITQAELCEKLEARVPYCPDCGVYANWEDEGGA